MIRINLIGRKVKQKKAGNRSQLFIYLGVIAVVFGFLFIWHQQLNDDLRAAKVKSNEAVEKIEKLKRVKQAWEQWQTEKADLDAQAKVFEALQADQLGPSMALQYLSYALTRLADVPENVDEAKAQELAGWNPKWDTRRIWLKSVEVKDQQVEIHGEAIDHQDVAELYRRMESSDMFRAVAPGPQRRKVDPELDIKFVEFSVTASISYVASAAAWKQALEEAEKPAEKTVGGESEGGAPAGSQDKGEAKAQ